VLDAAKQLDPDSALAAYVVERAERLLTSTTEG
jgi:hypothetical protein